MFYTTDADAARAFIRDKLRLPAHDVGDGWLIFDAPEVEVGCHPSDKTFHGISFYCDDIEATMAELRERGVEFNSSVKDAGYGLVTTFEMPGAGNVELYEPKYEKS
jgi:catechol 2,3-dioxygenase-like lactoylglutathione lyase family enzyme